MTPKSCNCNICLKHKRRAMRRSLCWWAAVGDWASVLVLAEGNESFDRCLAVAQYAGNRVDKLRKQLEAAK